MAGLRPSGDVNPQSAAVEASAAPLALSAPPATAAASAPGASNAPDRAVEPTAGEASPVQHGALMPSIPADEADDAEPGEDGEAAPRRLGLFECTEHVFQTPEPPSRSPRFNIRMCFHSILQIWRWADRILLYSTSISLYNTAGARGPQGRHCF